MKHLIKATLLAAALAPAAYAADVALELRSEAKVVGGQITLDQVCRIDGVAPGDDAKLANIPVAVVGREKYLHVGPGDIEHALRQAGVSPAEVELYGSRRCLIERLDVSYDEQAALTDWASEPADERLVPSAETLADVLRRDLAKRAGRTDLVIDFAEAEAVLNLPTAAFDVTATPRTLKTVGSVRWDVTVTRDGATERHTVSADVQMPVETLVLAEPVTAEGTVQASAVEVKTVLMDREPRHPLATLADLEGAAARRDLPAGEVLTLRHLRPVPLVRRGAFVTVTVGRGNVRVKTVAKALEDGAKGQVIRVRDEATRSSYTALVTGSNQLALGDAVNN